MSARSALLLADIEAAQRPFGADLHVFGTTTTGQGCATGPKRSELEAGHLQRRGSGPALLQAKGVGLAGQNESPGEYPASPLPGQAHQNRADESKTHRKAGFAGNRSAGKGQHARTGVGSCRMSSLRVPATVTRRRPCLRLGRLGLLRHRRGGARHGRRRGRDRRAARVVAASIRNQDMAAFAVARPSVRDH